MEEGLGLHFFFFFCLGTHSLAVLTEVLLPVLRACCNASLLPCGVAQKNAVSLCCVVPFGHNFPRW